MEADAGSIAKIHLATDETRQASWLQVLESLKKFQSVIYIYHIYIYTHLSIHYMLYCMYMYIYIYVYIYMYMYI